MIDLHSHILPGLDDGSSSLDMSVKMARIAVADGTTILACTPHITPSIYENSTQDILAATRQLQTKLDELEIPLRLTTGADFHISDTMLTRLRAGSAPTLAATNYFLLEPSHHVMPPRLMEFCELLSKSDYRPIVTHPERLTWIEQKYDVIRALGRSGAAMQITAGSLTGEFGKRPQYWSERMLDENLVDIIASDAHDVHRRPPGLSRARDRIIERSGQEVATRLVLTNPIRILRNEPLADKQTEASVPPRPVRSNLLKQLGF